MNEYQSIDYRYDAVGNIQKIEKDDRSFIDRSKELTTRIEYDYDQQNRLLGSIGNVVSHFAPVSQEKYQLSEKENIIS